MKKIAFLINSMSSGGAEKVLSVILHNLKKENVYIELICLENNTFYELPDNIKVTYLDNTIFQKTNVLKLLGLPALAWKLSRYIKKNKFDIVQSHLYRANYINCLSKIFYTKYRAQIVNTGTISRYKEVGLKGKINLFLIRVLYKFADLIILKSNGMKQDMEHLFSFDNERLVINNPYEISKITLLKKEKVEDFYFNCKKRYLITVGRFETFKRQDTIIRSLQRLDNNIELILIGDGYKRKELETLVSTLNLDSRVHFLGRKVNPFQYINKSDIFILSSDHGEGFPNVLVESMICKIPVISTDCMSGPREILAPMSSINKSLANSFEVTEYGILIPINNIDLLVSSIKLLLDNKDLKNRLINNSSKRVMGFNSDNIISKYKRILEIE